MRRLSKDERQAYYNTGIVIGSVQGSQTALGWTSQYIECALERRLVHNSNNADVEMLVSGFDDIAALPPEETAEVRKALRGLGVKVLSRLMRVEGWGPRTLYDEDAELEVLAQHRDLPYNIDVLKRLRQALDLYSLAGIKRECGPIWEAEKRQASESSGVLTAQRANH